MFGTYLATEHLKTDYRYFIIAAFKEINDGELGVEIIRSTNENTPLIEKTLARKLIEQLEKYT